MASQPFAAVLEKIGIRHEVLTLMSEELEMPIARLQKRAKIQTEGKEMKERLLNNIQTAEALETDSRMLRFLNKK